MRLAEAGILLSLLMLMWGCAEPPPVPFSPRIREGTRLRYAFVPGQRTRYLFRSSFSSQTPGSSDAGISVSQEMEIAQTTLATFPDGSARVGIVLERFKGVQSSPGQTRQFDTSKDPEGQGCPTELRGMAALIGEEIEFVQSSTGEVQAVAGLKTMYKHAVNSLSPTELQSLEHLLRGFSHKPLGLFGIMPTLPREPVVPGRQWAADRGPFPLFCGQRVYPCRYEFDGLSDGIARVTFADDSGQGHENGEGTWKALWTTETRGAISFDIEKGLLSHARGESTTYLRIAGEMQLRSKSSWELVQCEDVPGGTDSAAQSPPENATKK